MRKATIRDVEIDFPVFLPDATRALVKSVDTTDLSNAHIEGIVVNTLHLAEKPGAEYLESVGGIKKFMHFDGLVTSDSGGWQVFSLIHRSNNRGSITDAGVSFYLGTGRKKIFTPEESIKTQFSIGSDIVICLDDFTPPDAPYSKIKESVERTILWAQKCMNEYKVLTNIRVSNRESKPLLLAPVQGGMNKELRKYCAEKLVDMGFEAFGFGGYVVDDTGGLNMDISSYLADLLPKESIKFALGTGKPAEIPQLYKMGWQIFDCTLPTRDARHQRLYVFKQNPGETGNLDDPKTFSSIDIGKTLYQKDLTPIDPFCDCHTCENYTKAYLHHLFKVQDTTALRLATIHNLRHYTLITQALRETGTK